MRKIRPVVELTLNQFEKRKSFMKELESKVNVLVNKWRYITA